MKSVHSVSLRVTGPAGSDALALNDYIHVDEAASDDHPPVADAGADQNAAEGDLLSFSGVITDTDTPTGHTLLWNFGDGSTLLTTGGSTAFGTLNPAHAYGDNGVFTVTLTVTDTTGLSAADTLVVHVANVAPIVTIQRKF